MATNQATNRLGAPRLVHWTRPVQVAASVLAVVLAFAGALALSAPGPGGTTSAAQRAVDDALVQVRRDEREERYSPSVEDIRRALIEFRASEREEPIRR
jgi:hypothetical protein